MMALEVDRLSQISTNWDALLASHSTARDTSIAAQCGIVRRYCSAVYHYLLAATQDVHAADDLAQEFALRFVRGDFRRAEPTKGRFREYVKTVLRHLVADHFRAQKRTPQSLPDDDSIPNNDSQDSTTNAVFLRYWRQEILDRTWQELQNADGTGMFAVLHWKAKSPEGRSAEGARELSAQLQRVITPVGFRQTLHRAREKFAELLLSEVALSLGTTDRSAVEHELGELELIDYCRPLLNWPSPRNG